MGFTDCNYIVRVNDILHQSLTISAEEILNELREFDTYENLTETHFKSILYFLNLQQQNQLNTLYIYACFYITYTLFGEYSNYYVSVPKNRRYLFNNICVNLALHSPTPLDMI